jgi:hypothetical protein
MIETELNWHCDNLRPRHVDASTSWVPVTRVLRGTENGLPSLPVEPGGLIWRLFFLAGDEHTFDFFDPFEGVDRVNGVFIRG